MAVAYVQSTNYNSSSGISSSGTLVFGSTPTQGNLLLVGIGYAYPKNPTSAPGGWTLLDTGLINTSARMSVYYHVVGASETNSYTFTTTGGDFLSMVGIEVSGQHASTPINQHSVNSASNPTSITTSSVTPSVIGCLPISFYFTNDGTAATALPATISSGWTIDQNPQPLYHAMAGGHKNSLTTDTTTAISTTWSFDGGSSSSDSIADILLIAPSGGTVTATASTLLMMGV
jgi:hypothetical protein